VFNSFTHVPFRDELGEVLEQDFRFTRLPVDFLVDAVEYTLDVLLVDCVFPTGHLAGGLSVVLRVKLDGEGVVGFEPLNPVVVLGNLSRTVGQFDYPVGVGLEDDELLGNARKQHRLTRPSDPPIPEFVLAHVLDRPTEDVGEQLVAETDT